MNRTFQDKLQCKENRSVAACIAQRKPNNTGLPDHLKSGIENLSGYSMDDVKVHYNSSRPAQLQAHAYAQGNQIHLATGQEKHLPHEAWHVVQQKQGRVKPTMQLKSQVNINDDMRLEKEADVMGTKASQRKNNKQIQGPRFTAALNDKSIQRVELKLPVPGKPNEIWTLDTSGLQRGLDQMMGWISAVLKSGNLRPLFILRGQLIEEGKNNGLTPHELQILAIVGHHIGDVTLTSHILESTLSHFGPGVTKFLSSQDKEKLLHASLPPRLSQELETDFQKKKEQEVDQAGLRHAADEVTTLIVTDKGRFKLSFTTLAQKYKPRFSKKEEERKAFDASEPGSIKPYMNLTRDGVMKNRDGEIGVIKYIQHKILPMNPQFMRITFIGPQGPCESCQAAVKVFMFEEQAHAQSTYSAGKGASYTGGRGATRYYGHSSATHKTTAGGTAYYELEYNATKPQDLHRGHWSKFP